MDARVHEVKDHSFGALRRQYRESRDELADHLSLYQIHSATLETGVLRDRDVLAELALAEAHQAGYRVIVKEALANGRITNRGDHAAGVLRKIASTHEVVVLAPVVSLELAQSSRALE